MNKKNLLIIGTVIVGLGVGTLIGLSQIKTTEIITATNSDIDNETSLESTTERQVAELRAKLDKAIQEEVDSGCVEELITKDGETTRQLCGESLIKVSKLIQETNRKITLLTGRPEEERKVAMQNIREFMEKPELELNFVRISSNPYSDQEEGNRMEVYKDNEGMEYWINPQNNQIIQMGIASVSTQEEMKEIDLTPRYSKAELEMMAKKILEARLPNFEDIEKNATYEVKDKQGLVYFFRWTLIPEGFIQVGISRGGEITSYTNALVK
ncbi:MAG: hypothetical protein ACKKMP_03675 [Candidatus Nealsonbacteria bacterium]